MICGPRSKRLSPGKWPSLQVVLRYIQMAQVKNICTRLTELRHPNLLKRKIRFNIQHWLWSCYVHSQNNVIYTIHRASPIAQTFFCKKVHTHPLMPDAQQCPPPPCTLHSFEAMHGARSLAALRHGGIRRQFRSEINTASSSSSSSSSS